MNEETKDLKDAEDAKTSNKQNLINVLWEKYSCGNIMSKDQHNLMMNELFTELSITYAGNVCDLMAMIGDRKTVTQVINIVLELTALEKIAGEIIDGMTEVRSYECLA